MSANKVSYYIIDRRGFKQESMTSKEYDELLSKVYDKERILSYIDTDLINWGADPIDSYMLIQKARFNEAIFQDLNKFMKETDKIKKSTLLTNIFKKAEYEPKRT